MKSWLVALSAFAVILPAAAQGGGTAPPAAQPPSREYFVLVDRYVAMGWAMAGSATGESILLVDTMDVVRDRARGTAAVWMVIVKEQLSDDGPGAPYSGNQIHAEFDCEKQRFRYTYAEWETATRSVYVDPSTSPWTDVPPGSIIDNAMIIGCLHAATGGGRAP